MKVKIIDFGFSLICKPLVDTASVHDRVVTFCGTPTYMAPEIVNKRDHIGMYADRWSLGVLLYTMLQGIYPFRANS
jgi:serine/threonine protein kinase